MPRMRCIPLSKKEVNCFCQRCNTLTTLTFSTKNAHRDIKICTACADRIDKDKCPICGKSRHLPSWDRNAQGVKIRRICKNCYTRKFNTHRPHTKNKQSTGTVKRIRRTKYYFPKPFSSLEPLHSMAPIDRSTDTPMDIDPPLPFYYPDPAPQPQNLDQGQGSAQSRPPSPYNIIRCSSCKTPYDPVEKEECPGCGISLITRPPSPQTSEQGQGSPLPPRPQSPDNFILCVFCQTPYNPRATDCPVCSNLNYDQFAAPQSPDPMQESNFLRRLPNPNLCIYCNISYYDPRITRCSKCGNSNLITQHPSRSPSPSPEVARCNRCDEPYEPLEADDEYCPTCSIFFKN